MNIKSIATLIASIAAASSVLGESDRSLKLKKTIDYEELTKLLANAGNGLRLIDVRTKEEYADGHIPGAELLPYDEIEESFAEPNKDKPIVVYCRSGRRSAIAAAALRKMGYTNISDFGAVSDWKAKLTTGAKP